MGLRKPNFSYSLKFDGWEFNHPAGLPIEKIVNEFQMFLLGRPTGKSISVALHNTVREWLGSGWCESIGDKKKVEIQTNLETGLAVIGSVLMEDVEAALSRDPAAKNITEVVLCYPGIVAVIVYRIAHLLEGMGVPILPRFLSEFGHSRTGIDIHPGATIGAGFFIDHGTGIVIGETTVIGRNVTVYHGVTLGAKRIDPADRGIKRHPTIEDNVILFAYSMVLGPDTVVGQGSRIGANCVVEESVAPNSKLGRRAFGSTHTQSGKRPHLGARAKITSQYDPPTLGPSMNAPHRSNTPSWSSEREVICPSHLNKFKGNPSEDLWHAVCLNKLGSFQQKEKVNYEL